MNAFDFMFDYEMLKYIDTGGYAPKSLYEPIKRRGKEAGEPLSTL